MNFTNDTSVINARLDVDIYIADYVLYGFILSFFLLLGVYLYLYLYLKEYSWNSKLLKQCSYFYLSIVLILSVTLSLIVIIIRGLYLQLKPINQVNQLDLTLFNETMPLYEDYIASALLGMLGANSFIMSVILILVVDAVTTPKCLSGINTGTNDAQVHSLLERLISCFVTWFGVIFIVYVIYIVAFILAQADYMLGSPDPWNRIDVISVYWGITAYFINLPSLIGSLNTLFITTFNKNNKVKTYLPIFIIFAVSTLFLLIPLDDLGCVDSNCIFRVCLGSVTFFYTISMVYLCIIEKLTCNKKFDYSIESLDNNNSVNS